MEAEAEALASIAHSLELIRKELRLANVVLRMYGYKPAAISNKQLRAEYERLWAECERG